jgi:hypothetical protein
MNSPQIASMPQDGLEQFQTMDDDFLSQFDDAILEHALKTVNWHAKDVSQFLRSTTSR